MKSRNLAKFYKEISRESFKNTKMRHNVIESKKYKKPKYKHNLVDYIDELIEYEQWEEMNEN